MRFFVHDGNEAAKDFAMAVQVLTECLHYFFTVWTGVEWMNLQ